MSQAFNARFISNLSLDRLYRVYIERGELFFIRIGGQAGIAVGVAAQFGVVGAVVLRSLKKRGDEKLALKISELDRQHPSSHLSAHKHNFHSSSTAVELSSLEPAATIGGHGEHFGRWKLKLREAKEMLFQLESLDDMRASHELLPSLGPAHANNVVWDPAKNRFAKRVA